MDQPLPTFGIRHLRDDEPFSLLSINGRQYETTLECHPYAALSYVDEDDGENVTIGSGFELKQRLDDPPSLPAPSVPAYNSAKDKFEDRFIHLFDIQQKELCRAVWKRNQTTSVGNNGYLGVKQESNDDNDSISHIDLNSEYHDVESEKEPTKARTPRHVATGLTPAQHVNLVDAVPDLVDNLADLLQSTSETLRRAAEKSRTTKTSPIEDVMSGMSKIVAEVGDFGLSLLDSVSTRDPTVSQDQPTPSRDAEKSQKVDNVSVKEHKAEVEDHSSTASVAGSTASQCEPTPQEIHDTSSDLKDSTIPSKKCNFCSPMGTASERVSDSTMSCQNCIMKCYPRFVRPVSGRLSFIPNQRLNSASTSTFATAASKENSILDQESEDENADFSRRYPPLMSLRRANTVAGLHDRFTEPLPRFGSNNELTRHSSWVKRFPHRPVPYVLDAETQRRRGFAQNCFPTQRYSPGIDLEAKPPIPDRPTRPKPQASLTESLNTNDTVEQQIEAFAREFPPSKDIDASTLDCKLTSGVYYTPIIAPSVDSVVDYRISTAKASSAIESTNSATAQPSVDVPPAESSGAFFHRMMRDQLLKHQEHDKAAEDQSERHRLTRPKSMYLQRSNNNPFSKLDRSQTVSSATNPASRLNRPFDPWYPTLTPNAQPDTSAVIPDLASTVKALGETSKTRNSSTSDRMSLQRPFSPVWEDHLKPAKNVDVPASDSMDGANKFDRNGESSSMYSPPPRHMRSVPNLTRSASMITTTPSAGTTVNRSTSISSANAAASISSFTDPIISRRQQLPPQILKPDTIPIVAPPRPSNPFRMILQPTTASTIPQQTRIPPFPLTTPTNNPGPKVLPRKSVPRARAQKMTQSDRATQECLIALQDMGYGLGDSYLKSRLHIYAEAANGDVTDAVEMIEEDKRASKGQAEGGISL